MPNCQYEQQISLLLDGELSGRDASLAEAHLRTCAECARRYEEYRNLSALLGDMLVEPPRGFADSVMARIRAEAEPEVIPIAEARKRKKKSAFGPLLATAAMLTVIIGVVSIAGRGIPTGAELSNSRSQIVDARSPDQAPSRDTEDAEAFEAVLDDNLDTTAEGSMDPESFAVVLGVTPQLDEETTAEIRALLKDGKAAEAPAAGEKPVCTLTDRDVDTLVWIDGEDVIYTEDGEHFFKIEKLADTIKKILNPD